MRLLATKNSHLPANGEKYFLPNCHTKPSVCWRFVWRLNFTTENNTYKNLTTRDLRCGGTISSGTLTTVFNMTNTTIKNTGHVFRSESSGSGFLCRHCRLHLLTGFKKAKATFFIWILLDNCCRHVVALTQIWCVWLRVEGSTLSLFRKGTEPELYDQPILFGS